MTSPGKTWTLAQRLRGHDQLDWDEWRPLHVLSADQIPPEAERASLRREKKSHRGIGERRRLRHLVAGAVDQAFLDEICTLDGLERLDLMWPVTAADLSGLRNLRGLAHLGIDSPRNVTDFALLLELPALRRLFIENAKHLSDLDWLMEAHHLESLGVEGSIWTTQHLPGLKPLAGLRSLRGLYLTSVRLKDQDLSPLALCPQLQVLDCARFAPRAEFERLERLKPSLECDWFRSDLWD